MTWRELQTTGADGTPLHVRIDAGPHADAPTVVFAHSLGCTLALWDPQVEALAAYFRMVRYDLRGHGRSGAPDTDYTLAQMGADALAVIDATAASAPVHFVGLSLGGMVGMWLGVHHPQRLKRLVLANTTPHIPLRDMFSQRMQTARTEGMAGIAAPTIDRWLGPTFKAAHPAQRDGLVAAMAAMSAQGYAGCCAVLREADQRGDMARIGLPTLVVAGVDDPATPPASAQQLAQLIAGARVVSIANAAHLSNIENPVAFNDALLNHLLA